MNLLGKSNLSLTKFKGLYLVHFQKVMVQMKEEIFDNKELKCNYSSEKHVESNSTKDFKT